MWAIQTQPYPKQQVVLCPTRQYQHRHPCHWLHSLIQLHKLKKRAPPHLRYSIYPCTQSFRLLLQAYSKPTKTKKKKVSSHLSQFHSIHNFAYENECLDFIQFSICFVFTRRRHDFHIYSVRNGYRMKFNVETGRRKKSVNDSIVKDKSVRFTGDI